MKTISIGSAFNVSDFCSNFVDGKCLLDPERYPSCIGKKDFCYMAYEKQLDDDGDTFIILINEKLNVIISREKVTPCFRERKTCLLYKKNNFDGSYCQKTGHSSKCEGNKELCFVYVDYMDNIINIVG